MKVLIAFRIIAMTCLIWLAGCTSKNPAAPDHTTSGHWSALPGALDGSSVYALARDSLGDLYVGGTFASVNGLSANGIAKWDGKVWSTLGVGVDPGAMIMALACDNAGNLYVGGDILTAGGLTVHGVAKWDGNTWSALTGGVGTGIVYSLICDPTGNVYVGGSFTTAGGISANNIAMPSLTILMRHFPVPYCNSL